MATKPRRPAAPTTAFFRCSYHAGRQPEDALGSTQRSAQRRVQTPKQTRYDSQSHRRRSRRATRQPAAHGAVGAGGHRPQTTEQH
jgi:hypothetical protein